MSDLEKLCSVLWSCRDSKACLDSKHLSGQKRHFFVRVVPADRSVLLFIADYLSLGWVHVGGVWWEGRKGPACPEHWTSSGNPPGPRGKDKPQVSPQSSFPIQLIPLATLKFFEPWFSGIISCLFNYGAIWEKSSSWNMEMWFRLTLLEALSRFTEGIWLNFTFCVFENTSERERPTLSARFSFPPDSSCLFANETPMRSTHVHSRNTCDVSL